MPWPVYSERLLTSVLADTWKYYTVPTDRRAVIRSLSFHNAAAVPLPFYATIGSLVIAKVTIQAAADPKFFDMRHVIYAGEQLGIYCGGTGGHMIASGYVFSSAGQVADEPPETAVGAPPAGWLDVEELPSGLAASGRN